MYHRPLTVRNSNSLLSKLSNSHQLCLAPGSNPDSPDDGRLPVYLLSAV